MKAKSEAENRSGFQPNMLPLAACQLSFFAETVVGQTNIHTNTNIKTYRLNLLSKKCRILNLSTNADISTDTK